MHALTLVARDHGPAVAKLTTFLYRNIYRDRCQSRGEAYELAKTDAMNRLAASLSPRTESRAAA